MPQKLVSVIVPIYNISKYLNKCLDSLVNQTYDPIEVLLVDDGSTDGSSETCQNYAGQFEIFKYYRKENGGLSDARNFGICAAKGDYIAFIDGDDYVANDYIEQLVSAFDDERVDIAVCSYQMVNTRRAIPVDIADELISGIDAMKRLMAKQYLFDVVAWNKLYRKKLFGNIKYPVGKLHEDVFTTYKLFAASDCVKYLNKPLYYYVQRDGSIMSSMSRKRFEVLDAENEMRQLCTERCIDANAELESFGLATRISLIARIAKSGQLKELKAEYGLLRRSVRLSACLANPYIDMKQLLVCFVGKTAPQLIAIVDRCRSVLTR